MHVCAPVCLRGRLASWYGYFRWLAIFASPPTAASSLYASPRLRLVLGILVEATSQAQPNTLAGSFIIFVCTTSRQQVGLGMPSSEGNSKGRGITKASPAHLASSGRRRVLEGAHRTRLGRVHRSRRRCRGAIAQRVVRQGLGSPPMGKQCPTKAATVRLAPLGWRFLLRLEKIFVLLLLA